MRKFLFIIFLNLLFIQQLSSKVIVLYGTSCSGKTTLANCLIEKKPGSFKIIKKKPLEMKLRQEFLEKYTGKKWVSNTDMVVASSHLTGDILTQYQKIRQIAIDKTVEEIFQREKNGENTILDICLSRPSTIASLADLDPIYVLVFASLKDLSSRERGRLKKKRRLLDHHLKARKSMLAGYLVLFKPCSEEESIAYISSQNLTNFINESEKIDEEFTTLVKKAKEQFHCSSISPIPITYKIKPNVCVNTSKITSEEGAIKIINLL